MNNLFVKLPIAALLVLTLSCSKQLNILPTTSRVDGNAITDVKSARTVLNGVYYRFANSGFDYNNVPSIQWYLIQQVLPSELSGMLVNPQADDEFSGHLYTPATYNVDELWKYGYSIINAANGFLRNLEGVTMPSATRQQMQAEAKFLRAYANTTLLLYYGQYADPSSNYGIILRDGAVEAGSINQPRAPVALVYASIIADLNDAITDLPEMNTEKYYANKSAAKLLKARLLINRGTVDDYNTVVSLSTDLIEGGNFILEDSVKDIFLSKGFNSSEVILGVQHYTTQTVAFQNYQYYHQTTASSSMISLLANDPRNRWMYKTATDSYLGDVPAFTKYYPGDPNNISSDTYSELGYAFRLTEAYLLKAEALTLSGSDLPMARTLLKTVLGHAGVSDFQELDAASTAADLHLLIVQEYRRNFAGESGEDWFALRRLPFATVQQLVPSITKTSLLTLPIPLSETSKNNLIVQTPGY